MCLQSANAADISAPPPVKHVDARSAQKLLSHTNLFILDIRTPEEFKSFHIAGATNIDFHGSNFEQRVSSLDKSKTYLVHCAAGVRSAKACGKMSQLHFPNLYNLEGGFRAWEKAGKPVEKEK